MAVSRLFEISDPYANNKPAIIFHKVGKSFFARTCGVTDASVPLTEEEIQLLIDFLESAKESYNDDSN